MCFPESVQCLLSELLYFKEIHLKLIILFQKLVKNHQAIIT